MLILNLFAQTYDEGTYGAGNYEDTSSTSNTSGSSTPSGSSSNSHYKTNTQGGNNSTNTPISSNGATGSTSNKSNQNTSTNIGANPGNIQNNPAKSAGFDVLLIGTIICTVLFITLLIYFWRRHKKATQNINTDEFNNPV